MPPTDSKHSIWVSPTVHVNIIKEFSFYICTLFCYCFLFGGMKRFYIWAGCFCVCCWGVFLGGVVFF